MRLPTERPILRWGHHREGGHTCRIPAPSSRSCVAGSRSSPNESTSSRTPSTHCRSQSSTGRRSLAFLAEHGIAGRRRIALNGVINGVLSRAQGEVLPLGPGARDELLLDYPALAEAYLSEPIDRDEAVRIVGEVLGSERLGAQALEAHRARGLGREGHQALTGRSDAHRRNT